MTKINCYPSTGRYDEAFLLSDRVEYFCTEELVDNLMLLKRTDKRSLVAARNIYAVLNC